MALQVQQQEDVPGFLDFLFNEIGELITLSFYTSASSPFDTASTLQQIAIILPEDEKPSSLVDPTSGLLQLYHNHGWGSLWSGNLFGVLSQVVRRCTLHLSSLLYQPTSDLSYLGFVLVTNITSDFISYPFLLFQKRLQRPDNHRSVRELFNTIRIEEGFFGFWRGFRWFYLYTFTTSFFNSLAFNVAVRKYPNYPIILAVITENIIASLLHPLKLLLTNIQCHDFSDSDTLPTLGSLSKIHGTSGLFTVGLPTLVFSNVTKYFALYFAVRLPQVFYSSLVGYPVTTGAGGSPAGK
eukprot:TRINITY_DN12252_c0_g1_i1.p1 TRINITY_DN12252_c0_g1~~TRINITY_DN12252_c0_g1_i1.p1  ORF type:complete len:296 (+),score=44.08 TRINITY_DN12252_c0_g1_i1:34-921(+)